MAGRTNKENAHDFVEAIKKLVQKPENLENLENYLSHHFHAWLFEYAQTPDDITAELKSFAEMEL